MSFPVFFDTCALFGGSLNDLFLRLADEHAYRPLWSAEVLDELERNLSERVGQEAARRRIASMDRAFPEAMVRGYEPLVESMTCDPKDRHVLAAAIRGNAEVVVTFNLVDFPPAALVGYDLSVVDPDEFLLDQLDLHPGRVERALRGQVDTSRRPRLTLHTLLGALRRSGVPRFADEVLRHVT